MTQLEPAFEGLLPGHGHGPAQRSATASNQTGSQLPTPDSPPSTVHTPTASTLHSSVTAQQPQTDHESVGMVQLGGDEPSSKRLKLASDDHDGLNHFPTDKDIDDFLDQLHQ